MTFLMDEPTLIVDQEDEGETGSETDGEGEILSEPEEEDGLETADADDTQDM